MRELKERAMGPTLGTRGSVEASCQGSGCEDGVSHTCGSRCSKASPQSVPTARAPRKASTGRNRRGPRSFSRSRERGAGRLSSRTARALCNKAGEEEGGLVSGQGWPRGAMWADAGCCPPLSFTDQTGGLLEVQELGF